MIMERNNLNTLFRLQPELSLEQVSTAVVLLMNEVAEIKNTIKLLPAPNSTTRQPIGVLGASKILCKGIGTIYNLTSANKIPHYKQGNQLYFFEDELLAHIESGKKWKHTIQQNN
jgi:hypothetical protein